MKKIPKMLLEIFQAVKFWKFFNFPIWKIPKILIIS